MPLPNPSNNCPRETSTQALKGFLAHDEGEALYHLAIHACPLGPCLEVGSYCGKSTVYLGSACQTQSTTLYAVDHHRGSEEHQLGEAYHDPDLFNQQEQCMDSFPSFQKTLTAFNLLDTVVPIVTTSQLVARHWVAPLGMVFIDGGHSHSMALEDCQHWSKHITVGGILAIHDIFPNPEEGGQGPFLAMQAVLEERQFEHVETVRSLGILKRII